MMMASQQQCAIGLDIGGTKIAGGLVTIPSGQLHARRVIPTEPHRPGAAVLADSLNLARQLMQEATTLNFSLLGIGVGVCELVDADGNITSGQAVSWKGLPVQAEFNRLARTVLQADVRAHALAEASYGAGRAYQQFIFISVGTGISYSLVQNGKPYGGAHGNALILASSPFTTRCTHCGTLLQPVLEEFASGPALTARYNTLSGQHTTRAEEVLAAVTAGDANATEVVRSAGDALGVSIGWLVNVLDPQAVIVGGGLGSAGGLYWKSFVESARAHIWAETSRDVPIIPAILGPNAGVIGAATTLARQLSSP
jgi:glucokinase